MKAEADRVAVKHADEVEEILAKHSKELEDAGLSVCLSICLSVCLSVLLFARYCRRLPPFP